MTNLFQIFCTTQRGYDPSKYPQPPIVSAEPSRGHEWPVPLSLLDHKIPQKICKIALCAKYGKLHFVQKPKYKKLHFVQKPKYGKLHVVDISNSCADS